MKLMHAPDEANKAPGRTVTPPPKCVDPCCAWRQDGPKKLPRKFPERFKNIVTDEGKRCDLYEPDERPPALFCSPCKCELCFDDGDVATALPRDLPGYLRCRRTNTGLASGAVAGACSECGWGKRFPRCPTFENMKDKIEWRALKSTLKNVPECRADVEGKTAPASRNVSDRLFATKTAPKTFLSVLEAAVAAWTPHHYTEVHQHKARNAAVDAVAMAAPGTRLVVLLDWSEKLQLIPNSSVTGGSYVPVGVLVANCVYKDAKNGRVRVETHTTIFDDASANDVPHTHAGLRSIVEDFGRRSKQAGVKLRDISMWSDGGPKHFKLAENIFFGVHLQGFARAVCGVPELRLQWNYMCPYHGKGPYDAEGGLIKYYARRAMRYRGVVFDGAKSLVAWFSGCEQLCGGKATVKDVRSRGSFRQFKRFEVTRRVFRYISEPEVAAIGGVKGSLFFFCFFVFVFVCVFFCEWASWMWLWLRVVLVLRTCSDCIVSFEKLWSDLCCLQRLVCFCLRVSLGCGCGLSYAQFANIDSIFFFRFF